MPPREIAAAPEDHRRAEDHRCAGDRAEGHARDNAKNNGGDSGNCRAEERSSSSSKGGNGQSDAGHSNGNNGCRVMAAALEGALTGMETAMFSAAAAVGAAGWLSTLLYAAVSLQVPTDIYTRNFKIVYVRLAMQMFRCRRTLF